MNQKNIFKPNWRNTLGALAIGIGAITCINTPATATPIQNNFKLAQVGVRSRISSPTPLNLRPRVHIPLPRSNYSRYNYPKYNSGYDNHRFGDRYYQNDRHHHHHEHTHDRHHRRGKVIIISPSNHNGISNYSSDRLIRVIKR